MIRQDMAGTIRVACSAVLSGLLVACSAVLSGMLVACSAGTPAGAPAGPVLIRGAPDCDHCRLDMTLEVKLRDRPDVGRQVVGSPQAVVRDSTGRIFLVHTMDASSIHVFTADGAYVQSIGSRGQAPGQFSYIYSLLVDPDDNLYAFDRDRLTIYTPELLVRETKLMPLRVLRTLLVDEEILVAGPLLQEGGVGLPLHVLDADLRIVRSFAIMQDLPARNWQTLLFRGIALGKHGAIWTHPRNRYRIEEWHPATGTRGRTIERVADWFEPWTERTSLTFETPPQPRLVNAWQDADGLLWTLSTVGGEKWQDGLIILSGFNDVWIEYPELFWDTYIEVIDPETGRFLLSERVPQALAGVTNDGLAIGRRYPEGDVYQVDLWKLRVVR